jgi:hypothetical protein
MTGSEARLLKPDSLELNVIRAFGWSLIEYEQPLYQKFLSLSVDGSLMTFEDFKVILREMESKGFLQELTFQGKLAYRKLLIGTDDEKSLKPDQPVDEMKLVIGSRKAKAMEKYDVSPSVDPNSLGQIILQELKEWLMKESGLTELDLLIVRDCIEEIREALGNSQDEVLRCLDLEYPGIKFIIKEALSSYGSDIVMQSLQLIEMELSTDM